MVLSTLFEIEGKKACGSLRAHSFLPGSTILRKNVEFSLFLRHVDAIWKRVQNVRKLAGQQRALQAEQTKNKKTSKQQLQF